MVFNVTSSNGDGGLVTAKDDGNEHATVIISRVFIINSILSTLKPAMSTPAVYRCSDGHFRRIIFGLGPFIADYPEQVMLAGVKQGWCPRYVLYLFTSNYCY